MSFEVAKAYGRAKARSRRSKIRCGGGHQTALVLDKQELFRFKQLMLEVYQIRPQKDYRGECDMFASQPLKQGV